MWTGESEGLFSCIAFLGRRLRLSRWESSRRSRVRGGYAHFLYCHLSDALRAPPPSSRRSLQDPFARLQISPPSRRSLQGCFAPLAYPLFSAKPARVLRTACISPLLGEACKGAPHRLHIPQSGRQKILVRPRSRRHKSPAQTVITPRGAHLFSSETSSARRIF